MKKSVLLFILNLFGFITIAGAGEVDVINVDVTKHNRSFGFSVTVTHKDTGWKHYANKWDIVTGNGKILGTRVLLHPHVNEQPFTRSLSNVKIPINIKYVTVRGHDSVHKYGGKVFKVKLP